MPRNVLLQFSATLLVLLAALARAGIISAHLRTGPDRFGLFHGFGSFTDDVARFLRGLGTGRWSGGVSTAGGSAKSAGGLMAGALRHITQEIFESH